MSIGKKMKEYRKERGISQIELRKEIGCWQQQIARWEQGINKPNIRNLIKISRAMGMGIDELMEGEEDGQGD